LLPAKNVEISRYGEDLMRSKHVTLYTAPRCFFSEQAKVWLSQAGIPYTEVDTTADPAKAKEMQTKAGGIWITPTLVIGEDVGLGFDPEWIKARVQK